jgi:hypothetical protein
LTTVPLLVRIALPRIDVVCAPVRVEAAPLWAEVDETPVLRASSEVGGAGACDSEG